MSGPLRGCVANLRSRHRLIGYARVSKTDGSQLNRLGRNPLPIWSTPCKPVDPRGGLQVLAGPGGADRHHNRAAAAVLTFGIARCYILNPDSTRAHACRRESEDCVCPKKGEVA